MHIVTLIHVGTILSAIESNVYENTYRHTNSCWDNFISYRSKLNMHIVTLIHVEDNFISDRIKRV